MSVEIDKYKFNSLVSDVKEIISSARQQAVRSVEFLACADVLAHRQTNIC